MTKFNISQEWTEKALREHNPEPDQYTPGLHNLGVSGYINTCFECKKLFKHPNKRHITCQACEKTERSTRQQLPNSGQ